MQLTVIGTGSAGNAYLLQSGTGSDALLLDAGVSVRRIIRAVRGLRNVKGCFVTHEHGDHIAGAKEISNFGIRVYATAGTMEAAGLDPAIHPFIRKAEYLKPIECGSFVILPFPTQHDAQQPCGYIIRSRETGETLLYATDTYYLRNTFPGINYWLVECNYVDEIINQMAADGDLPGIMRNRLLGSHMSLRRLKDTLAANDLTPTRKIILCHLSDERSDEQRMVSEIASLTGKETIAASNGMVIDLELTPF